MSQTHAAVGDVRKSAQVAIKVTEDRKRAYLAAAARQGLRLPELVRRLLDRELEHQA